MADSKTCEECGIKFYRPLCDHKDGHYYPLSITLWNKRKYCSNHCSNKNKPFKYGSDHHNWVGDNVGYRGIHHWVNKIMGKATKCEECGRSVSETRIHWANTDHKYERIVEKWKQFCAKCHWSHDKKLGLR